ncbi:MAG TPA: tRNA (pseudouridine(54)-N(1))-methyltransferase TrmY [Methanoregulaceae archaeon]|mgnify:FL=1|nr:tRNA (pseudouridine(54)-N(1))-methyltransferase TrmY [Methanoregulaceae archaeon]
MPVFAVIGHRARTDGHWSLNDMPGGAGRMDVLCRVVNTSFFLSHDLRRDVVCYLVLRGEPGPEKTIRFQGDRLRHLNPDERSAGSLIKKALELEAGPEFRESTKGVSVRVGGLVRLLGEHSFALLDEQGEDIRVAERLPDAFMLSDHLNLDEEEMALVGDLPCYSVGPRSLHADHTITVLLNELDRRGP